MSFTVIATTDIRDALVKQETGFLQQGVDAAHKRLVYLAQVVFCDEDLMLTDADAHYLVSEYAIEYATLFIARMRTGLTPNEMGNGVTYDPFRNKVEQQVKIVNELEPQLTREVFAGLVIEGDSMASSTELVRG